MARIAIPRAVLSSGADGPGLLVLVLVLLSSCVSLRATSAPQTPTPSPVPPAAAKADVIIKDMAAPETVTVKVGQTLGVIWPGGPAVWQVDFPPDELTLLTPLAKLGNPGAAGWVWRATKAGEGELVFTARIPCPNPPCPENPAKYTVTVRIK